MLANKSISQIKAIENKNKKRLLEVNPKMDDKSGIYFLTRTDEDGLNEAWECAKKIADMMGDTLNAVFGFNDAELIRQGTTPFGKAMSLTPQEAIAKLEAYEAEKQIKVGDVVEHIRESNVKILVTAVYKDSFDGIKVGQSDECGKIGSCYSCSCFCDFERTGTNIDISSVIAEIGKE